jgi:hypothetical protein
MGDRVDMISERIRGGLTVAATERALGNPQLRAAGRRPTVLIVIGYLAALLSPLIGLIIGVVLARRDGSARRHGRRIIAIAVVLGLLVAVAQLLPSPDHGAGANPRPALVSPEIPTTGLSKSEAAMLRQAMREVER